VSAGDLVFDLGAGAGALTAPLVLLGARVVAVERDAALVERIARRFAGTPAVRVIRADVRTIALPRRPFHVVASLPFATTAAVVRRLVEPAGTALVAAELVVQREAAHRLAAYAKDPAGAWWGARFTVSVGRSLGPGCFQPPPSVAAAVLRIRRVRLPKAADAALARVLRECAQGLHRPARTALSRWLGPGQLRALGIDPRSPVGQIAPPSWRAIAEALAASSVEGPAPLRPVRGRGT
jgi:23S rRNA (adenine-N6)-dimethyltransferase